MGVEGNSFGGGDFCINIPDDLCGEEGMGTSSLFSKMFNSERLHRGFGATLQIFFSHDQSTQQDLRGPEATTHCKGLPTPLFLGLFPLYPAFVGLTGGHQRNSQIPSPRV